MTRHQPDPQPGVQPRESGGEPQLADIPVIDTGSGFAQETLESHLTEAHQLLDLAAGRVPDFALSQLDRVSRAWLQRWNNAHLAEIDAVAALLKRPGAYFFSVNYEWGCTCRVAAAPDGQTARLARVLDWRTPGLGRHVLAARVDGAAGSFTTLTWPGYTGVLSAMAPGRFSAALNQAPMRQISRSYVVDWMSNRRRVWNMPHPTPSHLLRTVFETARNFNEARRFLTEQPISTPAIFLLAGVQPQDTVVIERHEADANVISGPAVATNHWQERGWTGRPRGRDSAGRFAAMHAVALDFDAAFSWLKAPILNDRTRLAMLADSGQGTLMAQGFEAGRAATNLLRLNKT